MKNGSLAVRISDARRCSVRRVGRPLEADLPLLPDLFSRSHEDDLAHGEVPQAPQVAGVGRLEPEALSAHAMNGARRRHDLPGVQVIHVITRCRRQARVGRRHVAGRSVIERFALGVPRAEAVDRLDVGLEMGRERDVLRKRAEVVALCQHARRNQRRRQQGLGLPRLAERFERAIEIAEQPQRDAVERRLAQSEKVHAGKLVRLRRVELRGVEIAEDDLPLEAPKARLHALRERLNLRRQRVDLFGRKIAFERVAGTGKRRVPKIDRQKRDLLDDFFLNHVVGRSGQLDADAACHLVSCARRETSASSELHVRAVTNSSSGIVTSNAASSSIRSCSALIEENPAS